MLKKFAAITSLLLISTGALSGLITPTGSADNLDLRWGQNEANTLQSFDEKQDVYLADKQVRVDYLLGDNLFTGDIIHGQQTGNQKRYLYAGNYSSHLLHFDPLGTSSGKIKNKVIEFDSDIVAIILDGKRLNATDSLLGGNNTNYQKSASRRWESHDFLTLSSSRTLFINHSAVGRYWIDDARIITRSVAEPGSIALLGLGLIGLIGIRHYSK
jgi:hypothetical protein